MNERKLPPEERTWRMLGWTGVASALLICVMLVSGGVYHLHRERRIADDEKRSTIRELTLELQKRRLESYTKRRDEETGDEYITFPIEEAMKTVREQLEREQGR